VAVQFADLHDTPGRMLEKGVIKVRQYVLLLFMTNFTVHVGTLGYFRLENI